MKTSIFIIVICTAVCSGDQTVVDYISNILDIKYSVVDCFSSLDGFTAELNITNKGTMDITDDSWEIYFNNIRMIEPSRIRPNGTKLGNSGLMVYHVNGVLFKFAPGTDFRGFLAGLTTHIIFQESEWMVTYTDFMPNWYVVAPGAVPKVLSSTVGESLSFVGPFTSELQWKRYPDDLYHPYTPEQRMAFQTARDLGSAPLHIVPTPISLELSDTDKVDLNVGTWVVVVMNEELAFEASYLSEKLDVEVKKDPSPTDQVIKLEISDIMPVADNTESYLLELLSDPPGINITGVDHPGVFYGVQSLLSLYAGSENKQLPVGTINDYPRFSYRGQHMDIARNFHNKDDILRTLEAMAMYKLNKFYLHLTDDEAWRLEIPGLPELTELGAKRCHDPQGDNCLMPQLGSGPDIESVGSGYLSIQDYKDVLQYAQDRHVEVIPEFDVPGHAHAAINAMLARYRKYKDNNDTAAKEYLLTDLDDTSDYLSVQYFTDNAVNPCLSSTYAFIEHVMTEIKQLHQEIQPLKFFNFGGDEVPYGAWSKSPACEGLAEDSADLKELMAYNLGDIAHKHGLDLAAWEDGLMKGNIPFNRSKIATPRALGFFWDNIWEWGKGQRAYIMANENYQVVLAHATHLYFDHPYEPDPEERGYYWATRIAPARKTHGYMPDSIYDNMLVDGRGNMIDREDICNRFGCEELQPGKERNIIGLQGHLWSETVRTSEQLDYMIFPRLLALAERAWHKAEWESLPEENERDIQAAQDWENFANTLGYKELARLDEMNIKYRISPPGASIDPDGKLMVTAEYPGQKTRFSIDDGRSWQDYRTGTQISEGSTVTLEPRSADNSRGGRRVQLTHSQPSKSCNISASISSVAVLFLLVVYLTKMWSE